MQIDSGTGFSPSTFHFRQLLIRRRYLILALTPALNKTFWYYRYCFYFYWTTIFIIAVTALLNGMKMELVFQYISNKMLLHTVYFIWKLLYMFRVVLPPIIRSVYNCIYSVWYLSHRYCYLPLAAGSSNGVTNIKCCRYSCMRSWWWVEVPPETYRAVCG